MKQLPVAVFGRYHSDPKTGGSVRDGFFQELYADGSQEFGKYEAHNRVGWWLRREEVASSSSTDRRVEWFYWSALEHEGPRYDYQRVEAGQVALGVSSPRICMPSCKLEN